MEKPKVHLRKEELAGGAGRRTVLAPKAGAPVALWDGEPRRSSVDHDSVHDEP